MLYCLTQRNIISGRLIAGKTIYHRVVLTWHFRDTLDWKCNESVTLTCCWHLFLVCLEQETPIIKVIRQICQNFSFTLKYEILNMNILHLVIIAHKSVTRAPLQVPTITALFSTNSQFQHIFWDRPAYFITSSRTVKPTGSSYVLE